MLQTPIGEFRIIKNGTEIKYKEKKLPKKFGMYNNIEVDKRYQIQFNHVEKKSVVEFILEAKFQIDIEDQGSDEDLFYAVYNYKDLIIGVGVEGDIPGIEYEYLDEENKHGIKIIVSQNCQTISMKVNVPWLRTTDKDQIINVQLAVDPCFYV